MKEKINSIKIFPSKLLIKLLVEINQQESLALKNYSKKMENCHKAII